MTSCVNINTGQMIISTERASNLQRKRRGLVPGGQVWGVLVEWVRSLLIMSFYMRMRWVGLSSEVGDLKSEVGERRSRDPPPQFNHWLRHYNATQWSEWRFIAWLSGMEAVTTVTKVHTLHLSVHGFYWCRDLAISSAHTHTAAYVKYMQSPSWAVRPTAQHWSASLALR